MSTTQQQLAALRFMEMAVDPKRLAKAQQAFKLVQRMDLMTAFRDVQRALEAAPSEPKP